MSLFDLEEVKQIEAEAIKHIGKIKDTKNYFKEEVGQYLYNKWKEDSSDQRVLIYLFPMIQSIMVKYLAYFNGLLQEDVFNSLCIIMLEHLPRYKKESGRLFTYSTMILSFKLKDILTANTKYNNRYLELEDWDTEHFDIEATEALISFTAFLESQIAEEEEGATKHRFLSAMYEAMTDNIEDRQALIKIIMDKLKFPELLVANLLDSIQRKYNNLHDD